MNPSAKNQNFKSFKAHVPTFNEAQKVFKGVRFDVFGVDLPGKAGQKVRREVVVHPGAVLILPILDKDHIIMIRNERFAVGKELWELPAGTVEPNEDTEKTAARELIEETGYKAAQITPLTLFYTSPGICNEVMYTYVAKDLTHVGQSLDDSEKITVEIITWKKAFEMIKEGIIIDGKTVTTLLYYQAQIKNFDIISLNH